MTEEDLIRNAQALFEEKNWSEALPLFAQLVSVHPEKPEYNYKFGVCTLMGDRTDKRRPIRYLTIAQRSMANEPELLYYLGLAYYQNEEFANAMKFFNLYLAKLDANSPKRPRILEQVNACLNGMNLEHKNLVNEVISTNEFQSDNFHRAYRADELEGSLILKPENSPEEVAKVSGVDADAIRAAARLYGKARNAAIYYGLGVTEHSQGSTMVMGMANLAMATGNLGRSGVGVNPLRGQNNVQGSCDMGSFPHELAGYRHISGEEVRNQFEQHWGVTLDPEPGFRIPNMLDAAVAGDFKGMYIQGEDVAQSDPNTTHVEAALDKLECLVVQDLFLNETAKFAHVFLPGTSFLEKDGTFINAERRINRVRPVMEPQQGKDEWRITQELAQAMGYDMNYADAAEIMDEIAALTPTFNNVSFDFLDEVGSVQWPCNDSAPAGTPVMHVGAFVRGKGLFVETDYVPTEERTNRKFPLLLTTGRILSQYNVGAQTRRTANNVWYGEDLLEVHPSDAEARGITDGMLVSLTSRKGDITLRATITTRVKPGVVYTTFHNPETGANVVTTEYGDWATDCPEYKVTAVQIAPATHRSKWQVEHVARNEEQEKLAESR